VSREQGKEEVVYEKGGLKKLNNKKLMRGKRGERAHRRSKTFLGKSSPKKMGRTRKRRKSKESRYYPPFPDGGQTEYLSKKG